MTEESSIFTLREIERLLTLAIFKRLLERYEPQFGEQAVFLAANILNFALLRLPEGSDAARWAAENAALIQQQARMICHDAKLANALGVLYSVMLIRIGPTDPKKSRALTEQAVELQVDLRAPEELCSTGNYFDLIENLKEYVNQLWGKPKSRETRFSSDSHSANVSPECSPDDNRRRT